MPRRRSTTALAALLTASILPIAMMADPLRHAEAATLTVINQDGANEGFNDPTPTSPVGGNTGTTLGAQRLIAFQYAADIWGGLIDSGVEITIGANFDDQICTAMSTILGSAGTNTVVRDFNGAQYAGTWYPVALANKLAGEDLVPPDNPDGLDPNDIGATFNSRLDEGCPFPADWYYGLDGTPPANGIDFVTVVLHELAHGLGFQTFVSLSSGAKLQGFDDVYMRNLEDHSTGKLYPDMTDGERLTASTDTADLHWVGTNVITASTFLTAGRHVSGHVQMYAPSPAESGSSVSHFDTALTPDELMEPSYTSVIHNVGLTPPLFADIGWGLADLTGTWSKIKEGCLASSCLAKGKFVVSNDGLGFSPAGTVLRFYHSTDNIFDAGDIEIQSVTLGGLASGATESIKLKAQTSDTNTAAGGFVFAVVDADDDVIEQDETNNAIPNGL